MGRRETAAAVVNGAIVLAIPMAFAVFLFTRPLVNEPVRPPDAPVMLPKIGFVGVLMIPFIPLALIAVWRTHVHALRYRLGRGNGAQGIAEAGLVGFGIAIFVLSGGILRHPLQAPPYIVAYGGFALVAGLTVGIVLWIAASLVMRGFAPD